jgi:uncharacterized protein DUF2785
VRILVTTVQEHPMRSRRVRLAFLLAFFAILPGSRVCAQQNSPAHDRKFWRALIKEKFTPPDGQAVFPLAQELSSYLGSSDSELRDDFAYTILDVWIVNKPRLTNDQLLDLLPTWQSNLRSGIGETGTDTVFKRSFSALCLAALAEHDLKSPFLGAERFRRLLDNALAYLNEERDLRGFDAVKGWIHATAHTADLLQALAANPLFTVQDQLRLLEAVERRLSTASRIYSYGEQDRLAVAVTAVVNRPDFDLSAWQKWLAAMDQADQQVWGEQPPDDDRLKAFENNSYFLTALTARLLGAPPSQGKAAVLDGLTAILRKR